MNRTTVADLLTRAWPWWLFAALTVTPFLFVDIPGLVDLPSHIATYHVTSALDRSVDLQRYYDVEWSLLANLGVNLLVMPLTPLLGVERAAWLVAACIPPLTVAGLFAVARSIHRTIPPTTLLALPLVYGFPFIGGFVNYALSIALALLLFAAWIALKSKHWTWRGLIFAPAATLLWLCHVSGWGVLGLLAGGYELRLATSRTGWRPAALIETAYRTVPLLPPLGLMLLWRQDTDSQTYFHPAFLLNKLHQLMSMVRQDWYLLDVATAIMLIVLPTWLLITRRFQLAPALRLSVVLLVIAWLATPIMLLGSFYADYRLVPILFMVLAIALTPVAASQRLSLAIAGLALLAFLGRLAVTVVNWHSADQAYARHLRALDQVPRGSRVLILTPRPCPEDNWRQTPLYHLGSYAITRRDAFTNTLWSTPGGHVTRVRYNLDTDFHGDPSRVVDIGRCEGHSDEALPKTLRRFPRDRFDFVWLLRTSLIRVEDMGDLQLRYADEDSRLYRVIGRSPRTETIRDVNSPLSQR